MKTTRHQRWSLRTLGQNLSFARVIASALAFLWVNLAQAQNPQVVLQNLLQKYKGCILEQYETQQNMASRHLDPSLSGLSTTAGLQLRDAVTCVAGNQCTLASRTAMYVALSAQANRGDATDFEAKLKQAIPQDCFQCQKHQEWHTKHVHCTMDCGGNNGITKGPCFEGCKAGVDLSQLVAIVGADIRNTIQSLSASLATSPKAAQPASTTGGHTIATNYQYVTPPPENSCKPPNLGKPDYFIAPRDMLDWTPELSHANELIGFNPSAPPTPAVYDSPVGRFPGAPGSTLGANEGRVRAELRAVAAKRDPIYSLCQAAQRFTRNQPATGSTPSDHDFGNAFADLSVTGKASFARFTQIHPTEASLHGQSACAGASDSSLSTALQRAYSVASALRAPHNSPQRQALGWIGVSGEDDLPYRPVNVPSNKGAFPELNITVKVPDPRFSNVPPISTRYVIAHAKPFTFSRAAAPLVDGGSRKVPGDFLPALSPDAEVILFIPGMDSRLEEADDLTAAMHNLPGHNWTIIAMDFPTSGYADYIDHRLISPLTAVQCHSTPLLDFMEDYFVAFVDALDIQLHGQLKPRIKAVVGGSFGGNMSMRLGRRANTPWIPRVVVWSPASIWPSMIAEHGVMRGCDTGWNMLNDRAVNQSLNWAGLDEKFLPEHETPERRRELFYAGWDWSPVYGMGGPPQADCWFVNGYPCKPALVVASRQDRQETYNPNFRAWHWRLGSEQLVFSHQQFASGNQQKPLYLLNNKPMLLLSGCEDKCGNLGPYTEAVAKNMVNTPGFARFLEGTGHSLDNEHPNWVAKQIGDFIDGVPGVGGGSH